MKGRKLQNINKQASSDRYFGWSVLRYLSWLWKVMESLRAKLTKFYLLKRGGNIADKKSWAAVLLGNVDGKSRTLTKYLFYLAKLRATRRWNSAKTLQKGIIFRSLRHLAERTKIIQIYCPKRWGQNEMQIQDVESAPFSVTPTRLAAVIFLMRTIAKS